MNQQQIFWWIYIKSTFEFGNNIRVALEMLEELDINQHKPYLAISLSQDERLRNAEDEQFKIEFKPE